MIIQPIIDIAEICAGHGIKQAVISPGSRNAALTLAFARHPDIKTFVIPDERSAGYIALGLAQSSQKPVVLICTSGTAAANLYPAIIEAFYQQVSLLVLTADRPPEWTDQMDGQTIRQQNIYQTHVLKSLQFPVSFDHDDEVWHANRMINEAVLSCNAKTKGPVHVNVPIREPFYPKSEDVFKYSKNLRIINGSRIDDSFSETDVEALKRELDGFDKVMVLVGQGNWSSSMLGDLTQIAKQLNWVLVGDVTSNIHSIENAILSHDLILLNHADQHLYKPDLLITFGLSVLSKGLKRFLRRYQPKEHWHVSAKEDSPDTFQSLTRKFDIAPEAFFECIQNDISSLPVASRVFRDDWLIAQKKLSLRFRSFLNDCPKGEFSAFGDIMAQLPENCDLHLANSMPVRYSSYIGVKNKKGICVWSNRGASGIDGCASTAVGHAINSDQLQILITGDLAFFYDRNAYWHPYVPENLKVIVMNNHGGGIFRLIDGPKQQPELDQYFDTFQNLTAENTAKDFGMRYLYKNADEDLSSILSDFFTAESGKAILEIRSDKRINQEAFEAFKNQFRT